MTVIMSTHGPAWHRSFDGSNILNVVLSFCYLTLSLYLLPLTEEGSQSWLCGDFFSMADVSLAVTLHRLKFLGLSRRYWGNGNRVNLETYYERVVERPAFRRVLGHVNNILISAVLPVAFRVARKNAPVIFGTTLLIGVLGGATYLAFLYMKKRLTLSSWGRQCVFQLLWDWIKGCEVHKHRNMRNVAYVII